MNINDLTIGDAKEISKMFQLPSLHQQLSPGLARGTATTNPFIGAYCIARCYAAGVHAGEVVSIDGENVVLKDSRRLWSWKAKDGVALSGVAQNGIKDSKIDVVNPLIYLTGVCELIPTTQNAQDSIHGYK